MVLSGPWLMLRGPQELPIQAEQWLAYDGEVPVLLSQAYEEMAKRSGGGGTECSGVLLDLSMFTEPPLPYTMCKGLGAQGADASFWVRLVARRLVQGSWQAARICWRGQVGGFPHGGIYVVALPGTAPTHRSFRDINTLVSGRRRGTDLLRLWRTRRSRSGPTSAGFDHVGHAWGQVLPSSGQVWPKAWGDVDQPIGQFGL